MSSQSKYEELDLGYQIVADLIKRQEDVLTELDLLNTRVETLIAQLTHARHSESDSFKALNNETNLISDKDQSQLEINRNAQSEAA